MLLPARVLASKIPTASGGLVSLDFGFADGPCEAAAMALRMLPRRAQYRNPRLVVCRIAPEGPAMGKLRKA